MGPDDALAILAILRDPDVDLVAVTCVWGATVLEKGVAKCCSLLHCLDVHNVPVYRGASEALIESDRVGETYADPVLPASPLQPAAGHAAEALARMLPSKQRGEVWQLLAFGPLTNIALAIRLCPQLLTFLGGHGVDGFVAMGGALANKGNSGLASEFNWHCDPEAAMVVTQSVGRVTPFRTPKLVLVPWEMAAEAPLSWHEFDQLLGRVEGRPLGVSCATLSEAQWNTRDTLRGLLDTLFAGFEGATRGKSSSCCVMPVLVAVLVALHPSFVTSTKDTYVECELTSHTARGCSVIDWYGTAQSMKKERRWINTSVVTSTRRADLVNFVFSVVDGVAFDNQGRGRGKSVAELAC